MPKSPTPPWFSPSRLILTVLIVLLSVLLLGCNTPPTPLQPKPVAGVKPSPLATHARQPETPSECLPTCLDALTVERESWRTLLTDAALPGAPANASTTPYTER